MKYNDNGEWKDVQIKVANAIQNEYGESNNDGYSQNYLNDKVVNVSNEVDEDYRVNVLHSKNLLNYNTSVNGVFTVNSTSEILDTNNTAITSAWIPCEPNTTYRLYNPNGTSARQRWQTKASNGTITYMGETNTITTNSTAKYMRVYYYVGSTATSPSSITNVQIEKGSEFTGFEPYITPSINVDNEEIYNQNLMNYSTSEQVIGKWINGKPLYRITSILTEITTTNTETSKLLPPTNVDEVVKIEGYFYQSSSSSYKEINYFNPATNQCNFCTSTIVSNRIQLNLRSSWQVVPYITAYYTKTTD